MVVASHKGTWLPNEADWNPGAPKLESTLLNLPAIVCSGGRRDIVECYYYRVVILDNYSTRGAYGPSAQASNPLVNLILIRMLWVGAWLHILQRWELSDDWETNGSWFDKFNVELA